MGTLCPHCSTAEHPVEMIPRTWDQTHLWICPDCPNVLFEYTDHSDLVNLEYVLEND